MMWDAITEAMGRLYPQAQPWHVSYPDEGFALRAASAYPADGHWHFVSYGLGGQWADLGAPITGFPHTDGPPTGLTVLILTADPQLGDGFLQLVGVTAAEAASGDVDSDDPLLVTDPGRA
jgi:hypothetical protein